MSQMLTAKATGKNQMTRPGDLVRALGIRAGDERRFDFDDAGVVTVKPPDLAERLAPRIGYLRRDDSTRTQGERAAFLREMRGDVDG